MVGWRAAQVAALLATVMAGCGQAVAPFEDVTAAAGLGDAVPCYDAALADYDGDGLLDVYAGNHLAGATLHRNLGGFRFSDVTAAAGLDPGGDQHGVGWGDADGDGAPDLYVALGADHGRATKANPLWRNVRGRFVEESLRAGASDAHGRGRGVTWVDYDRDGRLDVFVANYRTPNALLWNRGDGTFEDRAALAKLARPAAVHVAWTDYDADGWPDVLFLESPGGLRLMRNRGDGTFANVTDVARIGGPPAPGAAFGDADGDGDLDLVVATGESYPTGLVLRDGTAMFTGVPGRRGAGLDFQAAAAPSAVTLLSQDAPVAMDDPAMSLRQVGDGRWQLRWRGRHRLAGRLGPGITGAKLVGVEPWVSRRSHRYFENRGDGTFARRDALEDVGPPGNGQAVAWGDVDNDGDLDLWIVHSGVEGADEPDALYLNDGRAGFTAVTALPPTEGRGSGAHFADLDGDGRLDLLLTTGWGTALSRGRHRVLRNVAPAARGLVLDLVGTRSNRPGLGAWITVAAGGRRQVRWHGGGALYAQDLVPVHVGLGVADRAHVEVRWPSGRVEIFETPAERRVRLVEGEGGP